MKKKLVKKYYTDIFLNSNYDDNYIKDDTRDYSDYDDWDQTYYISPIFNVNNNYSQFFIKKRLFYSYLQIRFDNKETKYIKSNNRLLLYFDFLYLKKISKLKQKITNIISNVDYKIFSDKYNIDEKHLLRYNKLKKIKNK